MVGAWRLPNIEELQSLIDVTFRSPALSNAAGTDQWTEGDAFSGVQSAFYWSSTTHADNPDAVLIVNLDDGSAGADAMGNTRLVWPVRGGQ